MSKGGSFVQKYPEILVKTGHLQGNVAAENILGTLSLEACFGFAVESRLYSGLRTVRKRALTRIRTALKSGRCTQTLLVRVRTHTYMTMILYDICIKDLFVLSESLPHMLSNSIETYSKCPSAGEMTTEERDFEPKAPFHHNDTRIWEAMGAQWRFKLK